MNKQFGKLDINVIDELCLESFTFFDFDTHYIDDVEQYDLSNIRLPFPRTAICEDFSDAAGVNGMVITLLEEFDGGIDASVHIVAKRRGKTKSALLVKSKLVSGEIYTTDINDRYVDDSEKEQSHLLCEKALVSFHKLTTTLADSSITTGRRLERKVRLGGAIKPKFNWTTVQVQHRSAGSRCGASSDRASPIAHMRRGHWRNYKNGRRVWIDAVRVGQLSNGFVFHDYVVTP